MIWDGPLFFEAGGGGWVSNFGGHACVLWVIACTRILDLAGALLDLDSTKHLLNSVFSLCLPSRDFFQPFFRLFLQVWCYSRCQCGNDPVTLLYSDMRVSLFPSPIAMNGHILVHIFS